MNVISCFSMKEKPVWVEIYQKALQICLFYNSTPYRRTLNAKKKKKNKKQTFFNVLLLFLVKILTSYRFSMVELPYLQRTITGSNLTIETLEQGMKYV